MLMSINSDPFYNVIDFVIFHICVYHHVANSNAKRPVYGNHLFQEWKIILLVGHVGDFFSASITASLVRVI